jgi:uncharacterized repeat protein (TIGR01451 family)
MLAARSRRSGRRGRCLLAMAATVGLCGLSAAPALAAGPEWSITMTHANPFGEHGGVDPYTGSGETFARESGSNTYTINVANPATTAEAVKVVDRLPTGMTLVGNTLSPAVLHGQEWTCKVALGGGATECTTPAPEAGKQYGPIVLRVHVDSQAANPSTNVATVSGGGAPEASTKPAEGSTVVTEAVPFGIESFTTSVLDSLGNPFSQAGGHPFEYKTELLFKYTTSDESGQLVGAGGSAKELQVELPPGFVGNLQNGPRCPAESLRGKGNCPTDTAVGYVHISIAGGIEAGGKVKIFQEPTVEFSSLVYNLEPTPGHVAALGFVVLTGTPIVLEAVVRSDRDYGVTIGDNAGPDEPRLAGVQLTTCENGAGGISPNFSCNAALAGSKPFLTNPTECSGPPPLTTVRANPWFEPADEVAKTVGSNLVGGELGPMSAMTGCGSLPFHPEIEFQPSPASEGGTSQADEPTGAALALRLPQSNEAGVNATAELQNVKMTLPAGMTVSPSSAHGLQACSDAQFGLGTEFGAGSQHSEPAKAASCPSASQIGTVEVFTPLLSGAPAIEGVPRREAELTCSRGMWSGTPQLSFQWLRNGVALAGATGREYAPVEADEGKALQCQVTATGAGGSSVAVSRDVVVLPEPSPMPPFPPASIAAPSGSATAGSTLTCAPGAWTSSSTPTFTYQWLRNGVAIAGASAESYGLTSEDEGKVIQCQVKGANAVGEVIADSAALVVSPVPSLAPLPGAALQGQLFVAEPECSPCTNADDEAGRLFRLFLQIEDPTAGVIVKLHGTAVANPQTGQLTTSFDEQPQQPFELLSVKLKGGPRAPLANPSSCGPAVTSADLTPWSSPETPDATPTSSFDVDFNGAGQACPGALPFSPSFNAGTSGPDATAADQSPSFSLTLSRNDREQDLSGIQINMPPGLVGKIAGIPLCGEAQANAGTCGPESQIGTSEAGAGPGPDPFFDAGRVYLTGPTTLKSGLHGPFGLSVVTPAVAGPFNLGTVVVRSVIDINPYTAAVTATSEPLPQVIDGVPLRLRTVNVSLNRPGFMLNPTNCAGQSIAATISAAQGASARVSSPFGLAGCTGLPFKPVFTASTEAHTSKTGGASLDVKVTYPPGAYANIAKTVTELPNALPSRLTTIQKACPDSVFEANPAACPEGSVIGVATARTPLLNNPLMGPAYLVSHGNRAFPDIEIVLQGENGVEVILDGATDIKKGITKTSFEAIPDSPVSSFDLKLPEGPHSALAANVDLCESQSALNLPTILTGQNGAVVKQNTKIVVTGCPPTVSITKARLAGNDLLVSVKTTAKGRVKISGNGLKTVSKNLNAGSYQIRVALTKTGRSMHKHHENVKLKISLLVGGQAVAKATTVRL